MRLINKNLREAKFLAFISFNIKAHPDKKRSAEEYDEMNKSNKITIDIVRKKEI